MKLRIVPETQAEQRSTVGIDPSCFAKTAGLGSES